MESRHYLLFLLRCLSTFFECEMKIPYKESNSESENMWSKKMLICTSLLQIDFPHIF